MHSVIETLQYGFNYPVNSVVGAVSAYNNDFRGSQADFQGILSSILGFECDVLDNPDHARVQVGYVVQGAVEAHVAGEELDPAAIYATALDKTRKYIEECPWTFAKAEKEVKLDNDGRPVPKRGSKGVRSYEVYCEMIVKGHTRKEIIEAFQDEEVMGMQPHTKSGATTYYQNMKKKYEAENG